MTITSLIVQDLELITSSVESIRNNQRVFATSGAGNLVKSCFRLTACAVGVYCSFQLFSISIKAATIVGSLLLIHDLIILSSKDCFQRPFSCKKEKTDHLTEGVFCKAIWQFVYLKNEKINQLIALLT